MSADVIHAVRVGLPAGRDHYAHSKCWCEPRALLRDLATGGAVFVHGIAGIDVQTTDARPSSAPGMASDPTDEVR